MKKMEHLLLLKIICIFGIAGLGVNALSTRGQQGQQQPAASSPTESCPNASLKNLEHIDRASIVALSKGIQGLPCDAEIEREPKEGTSLTQMLQNGFDYYSWLTFVALNSPASGAPIGKDAQAVWERWKQLPDVMRAEGVAPDEWGSSPDLPDACSKFKSQSKSRMVIHMEMEETYNEPFKSGPLFDQNGNYALFVIFMNKAMFDFIVGNKLYSVEGQQQFAPDIDFPSGDANGAGAVMVKASWRILTAKDDASTYHTAEGLLYLPGAKNECKEVQLGLIGFHVGHKTASRRQWIWTTFEHKKNAPTQDDVDNHKLQGPYNFYKVADTDKSHINRVPPGPWGPLEMEPPWDPESPSSFTSQIVRTGFLGPDFADVKVLNEIFQKFLEGTAWANYELITTQWPSDSSCAKHKDFDKLADSTCSPFPTYLANSTLETFSQPLPVKNGGVPLASSSCISCHNNATTHHVPATRSDFTYILEKAQREHGPPK
jgi:hypothetical protein